jgi:hypothetical protein
MPHEYVREAAQTIAMWAGALVRPGAGKGDAQSGNLRK